MPRRVPPEIHVNEAVEEVVKRLGRNLVQSLEELTPKDTGLAASSWIPRFGSHVAIPLQVSKIRTQRLAFAVLQRARRSIGLAQLRNYSISLGNVFIANDLPYIARLERGHSGQAPRGFIGRAIRRAITRLDGSVG